MRGSHGSVLARSSCASFWQRGNYGTSRWGTSYCNADFITLFTLVDV
jgi:hypothetical protein